MITILHSRRAFLCQAAAAGAAILALRRSVLGGELPEDGPLQHAMKRAARCCLAWLDPEQHFQPTGGYEVAHDTGRWWDAMLRYEAVSGTRIPENIEIAMMENLRALTDNAAGLLTIDHCNPHNLRESMLAYTELVRHRQSDWARVQGHKLVETIANLLDADGQLNYAKLAEMTGKPLTDDLLMVHRSPPGHWFSAVGSTGRAIEAIVWFHDATGDDSALKLANRLAEGHLRNIIDPSGKVRAELLDPKHVSHSHSYCGTLRGLLLYGLANGKKEYVDSVARTYGKGLWGTVISHSGWTPHDQGKIRFADQDGDPIGEHGSCSDVMQIALWLAQRAGQTDLLDDVERLIRARLLPSQIVDPANPRNDGAWGVYTHPFGRGSILDVFAAVLHSLTDVYQNIVTVSADGVLSVNLHFDIDTPSVNVRSKRDTSATLHVTPKHSGALRIRVPAWASRESVRLSVADKNLPLRWDGVFLLIDKGDVVTGSAITLQHDLPERQTVEEMPISRRRFHLTWRGDEVVACDPTVAIYPAKSRQ